MLRHGSIRLRSLALWISHWTFQALDFYLWSAATCSCYSMPSSGQVFTFATTTWPAVTDISGRSEAKRRRVSKSIVCCLSDRRFPKTIKLSQKFRNQSTLAFLYNASFHEERYNSNHQKLKYHSHTRDMATGKKWTSNEKYAQNGRENGEKGYGQAESIWRGEYETEKKEADI